MIVTLAISSTDIGEIIVTHFLFRSTEFITPEMLANYLKINFKNTKAITS